jgi:hypothetical protein
MFSDGVAGAAAPFDPDVTIAGAGFRATFIVESPDYITDADGNRSGWHHICARIAPWDPTPGALHDGLPYNSQGHWEMVVGLSSDWDALIADVIRLALPIEATTTHETVGYDNIYLSVPCCTDFNDNDLHGYGPCQPGGVDISLSYGGQDGPMDIYLHAYDLQSPPNSAICANPDCLDNLTVVAASGCGALCYDVNMFSDGVAGTAAPFDPDVTIAGAGFRATFIVESPDYITDANGNRSGWHHICARIAPWDPTSVALHDGLPYNSQGYWDMKVGKPSDWDALLAGVTRLALPIEATTTHETVYYDNICVRDDVCPPVIPTLSEWGAIIFGTLLLGSVAFYIWRRRRMITA